MKGRKRKEKGREEESKGGGEKRKKEEKRVDKLYNIIYYLNNMMYVNAFSNSSHNSVVNFPLPLFA